MKSALVTLANWLFARVSGRNVKQPEINPVPEGLPTLRKGDTGPHVQLAQNLLMASGYFSGEPRGNFLDLTLSAVVHFQQGHIGPKGTPLEDDGVVGPDTWWALFNPSGAAQRQNIKPAPVDIFPGGTVQETSAALERRNVLLVAKKLHEDGTREVPDGSNTGDGVTKFHKWYGMGPAAWCMMDVTWCFHQATGHLPLGRKLARVEDFVNVAKERGAFFPLGSGYVPRPGDFFIILHGDGTGHIGVIAAVESWSEMALQDVYEGNSGNRHALRRRQPGKGNHIGYVNPYGDAKVAPTFRPGLGTKAIAATTQDR